MVIVIIYAKIANRMTKTSMCVGTAVLMVKLVVSGLCGLTFEQHS